jgi:hypothetical protein
MPACNTTEVADEETDGTHEVTGQLVPLRSTLKLSNDPFGPFFLLVSPDDLMVGAPPGSRARAARTWLRLASFLVLDVPIREAHAVPLIDPGARDGAGDIRARHRVRDE